MIHLKIFLEVLLFYFSSCLLWLMFFCNNFPSLGNQSFKFSNDTDMASNFKSLFFSQLFLLIRFSQKMSFWNFFSVSKPNWIPVSSLEFISLFIKLSDLSACAYKYLFLSTYFNVIKEILIGMSIFGYLHMWKFATYQGVCRMIFGHRCFARIDTNNHIG